MKKLNKTRIMAIFAQIIAILSFLDIWQYIGVTGEWVNILIGMVLQLLVVIGIMDDGSQTETVTVMQPQNTVTPEIKPPEENDNDNTGVL